MTKIDITVGPKRHKPDGAQNGERRGPLARRSDPEYLPRRKRRAGGISFYDLGQIWNGSAWADVVFSKINTGDPIFLPGPLVAADFAVRDNQIFAYNKNEWKTRFRKIVRADCYSSAVPRSTLMFIRLEEAGGMGAFLGDLPMDKFTPGGTLMLSPEEADGFNLIPNDWYFVNIGLFTSLRATIVRDPAAPAAAFTPSATMDVYLFPSFNRYTGESMDTNVREYLNMLYANVSRRQFLDHGLPSDPLFAEFGGSGEEASPNTVRHMRTIEGARTIFQGGAVGSAEAFHGGSDQFHEFTDSAGVSPSASVSDTLVAVIKQGADWYYFWIP